MWCFLKWWISPTNPWVFLVIYIISRLFHPFPHYFSPSFPSGHPKKNHWPVRYGCLNLRVFNLAPKNPHSWGRIRNDLKGRNGKKISILVIQSALFGMVKWPFGKVKWPPTGGWKGHFESPGWKYFDMDISATHLRTLFVGMPEKKLAIWEKKTPPRAQQLKHPFFPLNTLISPSGHKWQCPHSWPGRGC